MINDLIEKYHANKGYSFGGKNLFYETYPNIDKKDIDQALSTSDVTKI